MAAQPATAAETRASVVVVFRNDDPSGASDAAHEARVASVFDRWGITQTLGVIPFCTADDWHDRYGTKYAPLDENGAMIEFLRTAHRAGWELALHGYTHRTAPRSLPRRREYFEFKRLGVADAEERIRRGAALLERTLGVRPRTFIPPWNRIDEPSLNACARAGLDIVSAGPFVPPVAGILNLGVDCTIAELPGRVDAAVRSGRQVFIRVMYHSRTTRTPADLAALERAVRLVAELPECESLTIDECVRRHDHAVRQINEAARNTVPQDEVPGTARARATVYRRIWPRGRLAARLAAEHHASRAKYLAGDYDGAAAYSAAIDRASRRLVRLGRLAVFASAGAVAATLAAALAPLLPPARLYGAGTLVAVAAGVGGWWSGTSPDTRREMRAAALTSIAGGAAGLLLRELLTSGVFSR